MRYLLWVRCHLAVSAKSSRTAMPTAGVAAKLPPCGGRFTTNSMWPELFAAPGPVVAASSRKRYVLPGSRVSGARTRFRLETPVSETSVAGSKAPVVVERTHVDHVMMTLVMTAPRFVISEKSTCASDDPR